MAQSWIEIAKAILARFGRILVGACTLPYYRFFHFNTLDPIQRVASYTVQSDATKNLLLLLSRWRVRKVSELQFISIACAIVAGAVIGSFSWNTVANAYWLASALWYCSLVFSVLGIMISAQQIAVLAILDHIPRDLNSATSVESVRRLLPLLCTEIRPPRQESEAQLGLPRLGAWRPQWKMIFLWQCPQMFLSYSFILFLSGLTLLVCTPLIHRDPWGPASNIAIIYLSVGGFAALSFVLCSYWVYHYVDLEHYDTLPEPEFREKRREEEQGAQDQGVMSSSAALGR